MPVTCTADNLATESACFVGLSPSQKEAIKIYLLAVLAGVEPDPDALAELAECLTGLSPVQQQAIQTYLLCQIANGGVTPPVTGGDLDFGPDPTAISGSLNLAGVALGLDSDATINEFTYNSIETVGASISPPHGSITSLSLPALVTVAGDCDISAAAFLTTLDLGALATVGGQIYLADNFALTTLTLGSLTTVGGHFTASGSALLANFSAPLWLPTNGTFISFQNCALNAASVNHILARCVAAAVTTCNINLSGGTNAAPTGQGIVDAAALTLAGNTVTTN